MQHNRFRTYLNIYINFVNGMKLEYSLYVLIRRLYIFTTQTNFTMKKITILAIALVLTYSVQAQQTTTTVPATEKQAEPKDITKILEFKNADYDFGKIPFGKQAEYDLMIKNISNDSVTLDKVQVACGCTTPKYEAGKKFGPNETIKITLGFNGGTDGVFTKFVTVFFNDNMSKQVSFKGETYKTPDTSAPANSPIQKMKTGSN